MRNLISAFLLIVAPTAFASKVTVRSEPGNTIFIAEGCNTLKNITGNLDGYSVQPKLDWDHDIWVCGSLNLKGENMLSILKQVASLTPDCFNFGIDEVQKTVHLGPGPGLRVMKMIKKTEETYVVDGRVALTQPDDSEREIKVCVLDPASLEEPFDKILK